MAFFPLLVDVKRVVIFGQEGRWQERARFWARHADRVVVYGVPGGAPPADLPEGVAVRAGRPDPAGLEAALAGATLVISQVDDDAFNERLAAACRRRNVLLNVGERPDLSSVYATAVIEHPALLVSISTRGACPFYARKVREELEAEFAHRGRVASVLAGLRRLLPPGRRGEGLAAVYADPTFQRALRDRDYEAARRRGEEVLGQPASEVRAEE